MSFQQLYNYINRAINYDKFVSYLFCGLVKINVINYYLVKNIIILIKMK